VSEIASRIASVAKIAFVGAFVTQLMPTTALIANAIADGDFQSMPKITDLTSNAMGKAVVWPAGVPGYVLASAQLNGALQFGFDHDA
jgi:hypothetical protein